jgi:tetratricopeptide (TPR) repeat protein
VLTELARVHRAAQRPEEARRAWQQAQELSPDDPDIAANLEQLDADLQAGGGALPARTGSSPGAGRQSAPGRMPSMRGGVGMRSTPGARTGSPGVPQNVPRSATGPIAGPQTRPIARSQQASLTTPPNGARAQPPPPPPMSSPGVLPAVPPPGQAGSMSTIAPMTQLAAMSNVPKLLKETEVYVKYGLHEKALDHLGRVFAIEPDNTEALEKAKTLAIAMKRPADAAESLAKLVRLYSARSDPRADTAKAELRELDPSNVALGLPAKLGAAFSDDDRAAFAVTSPVRAHALAPAKADPQRYEDEEDPFTDDAAPVDRSAGDADDAGYARQEAADISGEYAIPADREPEGETEGSADFPMGALVDNDHERTLGEEPPAEHHDEALNTVDESLDEGAVIDPAIAFFVPLEAQEPEGEDHFASDLAEADFYIDAGLPEDARAILEGILLAAPDHPGAHSRLASLAAQGGQDAAPLDEAALEAGLADAVSEADTMAAELAAELASEVAEFTDVDAGPLDPNQTGRIDEANPQAEAVHREDAQTHYDLGIAYKEMGLLDEAVAEFQLALEFGGGVRKVDCITILGVCAIEMGRPEEAVEVLTRGMQEPGLPADALRALGYELGQAYEALGENQKALGQYKLVERSERGFRDAAARIQRLGGTITQPIQTARPKTAPIPKTGPIGPQQTQPPPPAPAATPAPPTAAATPEKTAQESADELQQRRNRKIGFV